MIGAVAKFVAVIALTFAIFGVAAWVFRTDLVYQFGALDQPPGGMPRTEMRVIPEFGDDPALTVWLTEPAPGQPYIVYFMGMGGALSVHEPRLRTLAEAGFGIAAMAYRGGGGQEGAPGEAALMQDARRLYAGLDTLAGREVRDTERVIYGFSFGSLIAAKLAAEQEELAVVLEAPGPDLCTMNFGGPARLPGCMIFAGNRYEAMGALSRIDAPVLVCRAMPTRWWTGARRRRSLPPSRSPSSARSIPAAGTRIWAGSGRRRT